MKQFYRIDARYGKLILFCIIMAGILSCKKEEKCLYDLKVPNSDDCRLTHTGDVTYTINGVAYTEHTVAEVTYNQFKQTNNTLTIMAYTFGKTSNSWEFRRTIKFGYIPIKEGVQYAKNIPNVNDPFGSFGTSLSSTDHESRPLSISYVHDPESEDSFIEITKLDLENRLIEGNFNMRYIKRSLILYPEITDTLRIIGQFKAPINIGPAG